MKYVQSKKNKIIYFIVGFMVFLIVWVFWLREYLMVALAKNLLTAMIFYYVTQYTIIIWLFISEKGGWRRIFLFILVGIVLSDLVLGFPFLYATNGLAGQSLEHGGLYSEDAIFGMAMEHHIAKCSSYQDGSYNPKALPPCSKITTWTIFLILNLIMPLIILIIILTMFIDASKSEIKEMRDVIVK